ncbi:hypothetical protein ElyMa_007058400 [Elysia marginata]|uniref:Uncharacterized protein n=1 Tax=Elysia marginata TaxID=1093978 RepID=A0AAV4JXY4_9GAST|nr:hypothetical protein ElyMa_007058400 [Elysia marginata]
MVQHSSPHLAIELELMCPKPLSRFKPDNGDGGNEVKGRNGIDSRGNDDVHKDTDDENDDADDDDDDDDDDDENAAASAADDDDDDEDKEDDGDKKNGVRGECRSTFL